MLERRVILEVIGASGTKVKKASQHRPMKSQGDSPQARDKDIISTAVGVP